MSNNVAGPPRLRRRERLDKPNDWPWEERIKAAVHAVGGAVKQEDIEQAIRSYDSHFLLFPTPPGIYDIATKAQKTAAELAVTALKRLEELHNDSQLLRTIKMDMPGRHGLEALREKIKNSIAAASLENTGGKNVAKRRAALAAAEFCRKYNLPLNTYKKGVFCRLAPCFYRGPRSGFYQICREVLARKS